MPSESSSPVPSSRAIWTGRVLSALPVAALTMSSIMKFVQPPMVLEGMAKAGWNADLMLGLGIVELVCTVLYAIPQTAVLGAILLTGYLGGATATHVRVGEPWFGAVMMGVMLWLGLALRDPRLWALIPLRKL